MYLAVAAVDGRADGIADEGERARVSLDRDWSSHFAR